MKVNFSPVRDTISAGVGVLFGGAGLVGTAAKKVLIAKGDGFGKRFLVGLAATFFTGGAALLPYLIATPGREAKADVQAARSNIVDDRY
jgi:hypothetical protein